MENINTYQLLTKEIFDKVIINENQPCVLLFVTEWSGNAEIMNSMLNRLSKDYYPQVKFYQVDINRLQQVQGFFGVQTIPTLVFVKGGEMINKIKGLMSAKKLKGLIDQFFADVL